MIFTRSLIGTPEPPSTRRKLDRVGVLLCHEVGVGLPKTTRYRSANPVDVLRDARSAAAYGVSSARSWEYNYMIGLDGSIFTQAGEYMAQHCLNFNPRSGGVLMLNALDVACNAAQIDSWWTVRAHMVAVGSLAADHQVAPHYRYRSTSCCGVRAQPPGKAWNSPTGEGRLGNLIPALTHQTVTPAPAPPAPIPPPTQGGDMQFIYPTRISDTRTWPGVPLEAGREYDFTIDPSIVPAGAAGFVANVTAISAGAAGFVTVWGAGPRPNTSCANFDASGAIASAVATGLSGGGFRVYVSAPCHLLLDATAWA